ncbi:FAD-dependent oxidoreductase [Granulicella sp. L60]|uniref:FAD-dependent oxidoreductase n=1 Tax=Granulicella sp. L60 TaxID=1641866 RepID=UPI0020B138EF|nr:FAD-dependent oxidoreductase [Granulicella sp. L60]
MAIQEEYDAIVIGSGEAGKYMAWHLALKGQRVATVEDKQLGGACPNVACLPSKNIIHSAKVVSYFRRGDEFGLEHGDFKVEMAKINSRRKQMVDGLRKVHITNPEKNHAEIIMGFGRFVGQDSVQVALNGGGTRTLRSSQIFIDTGSRATIDLVPGLIESKPLTHVEALELETVPEHLLILGGGHVGLEFAQAMRRFGARVTVIERNQALAQWEDPDVSDGIAQLFQDEGI